MSVSQSLGLSGWNEVMVGASDRSDEVSDLLSPSSSSASSMSSSMGLTSRSEADEAATGLGARSCEGETAGARSVRRDQWKH